MEYSDFRSEIVRRGGDLLSHTLRDRHEVTSLLLLLSAGFVMVYERRSMPAGNFDPPLDQRLKQLGRVKGTAMSTATLGGNRRIFEELVGREDWLYRIGSASEHVDRDPLVSFSSSQMGDRSRLTVDRFLQLMRNGLAHGQVYPESPRQRCGGADAEIDRIIFAARDREGDTEWWQYLVFSPAALGSFWADWCSLVLGETVVADPTGWRACMRGGL